MKIAINGFGRIGRTFFRAAHKAGLEVVAINDLCDLKTLSYLLKHDSTYGDFEGKVETKEGALLVDGKEIKAYGEKDPTKLPWGDLGVDLVIESTGVFREYDQALMHIKAGAKYSLITAPFKGEKKVKTIIFGVNEESFDPEKDRVINTASCTTTCLVPVADVLNKQFKILKASMTTAHAVTMDQSLQDSPDDDPRRGRSVLQSIIPTTTGATQATSEVIEDLKDKMDGMSLRVPMPVVSVLDFVAVVGKKTSIDEVNQAMKNAAGDENYKGAIATTEEELVSADFKSHPAAAIVDLNLTKVIGDDLVKVVAFYDNEMGYSIRLAEFCKYLEDKI